MSSSLIFLLLLFSLVLHSIKVNLLIKSFIFLLFCLTSVICFLISVSGTKMDLREDKETLALLSDQGQSPVKREAGQKLSNKIRAVKYMECSALTQRGLKQVSE